MSAGGVQRSVAHVDLPPHGSALGDDLNFQVQQRRRQLRQLIAGGCVVTLQGGAADFSVVGSLSRGLQIASENLLSVGCAGAGRHQLVTQRRDFGVMSRTPTCPFSRGPRFGFFDELQETLGLLLCCGLHGQCRGELIGQGITLAAHGEGALGALVGDAVKALHLERQCLGGAHQVRFASLQRHRQRCDPLEFGTDSRHLMVDGR